MVNSRAKQLKIILLSAGYLFVVLSHVALIMPGYIVAPKAAVFKAKHLSNSYEVKGKRVITVKKVSKSTLYRQSFKKYFKALIGVPLSAFKIRFLTHALPLNFGNHLLRFIQLIKQPLFHLRL